MLTLKDFLISGVARGSAMALLAEFPLTTYSLVASPRLASSIISIPHPAIGLLPTAVMSGYLGAQRFMQLISDKETIKNIAERMVPAFPR